MNTKKKYADSFLLSLIILVMAVLSLAFSISDTGRLQETMKYDGTYSLYVSLDSGMTINWITNKGQHGKVALKDENGNTIEESTTKVSRVHSFSTKEKPNQKVRLEFGGEESGIESVLLRPDFPREKGVFKGVDSVYLVGDVHGMYDNLINLLKKAGVINSELKWQAGKAHLVFLGDQFDRGDDVTKALWFIHELEPQAKKQGGKVHLLLGNHEIMITTKDLRYLSRKEKALSIAYKVGYDHMYHPTKSYLGAWLTSKPSVIKIDGLILAHGGIVDLGTPYIEEFNDQVYKYMQEDMYLDITKEYADSSSYDPERWLKMKYFFYSDVSPFWYRGYALSDTLGKQLDGMLSKYKSKVHIVGHTPMETITSRYKGKFITTDLTEKATELVLMKRKRNKYERFKIDSEGQVSELVSE